MNYSSLLLLYPSFEIIFYINYNTTESVLGSAMASVLCRTTFLQKNGVSNGKKSDSVCRVDIHRIYVYYKFFYVNNKLLSFYCDIYFHHVFPQRNVGMKFYHGLLYCFIFENKIISITKKQLYRIKRSPSDVSIVEGY